jgi:hypothetical protein
MGGPPPHHRLQKQGRSEIQMRIHAHLSKLIVSALFSVFALSAQAGKWAQEPQSIFGIELGQQLQIPICMPEDFLNSEQAKKALCKEDDGDNSRHRQFLVRHTPLEDELVSTMVMTFDDRVVSVFLSFPQVGYSTMREMFATKYGPPHHVYSITQTNKYGKPIKSEICSWEGTRVKISVIEHAGKTDTAAASLTDTALDKQQSEVMLQSIKKSASKLD